MSDFIAFATYFMENLLYYLFILVVLIAWDSLDFYIEIHDFSFFRSRIFGFYFVIRAFFSIVLMELALLSGLVNVDSKVVLSFVTPLIISTLVQNLVVNIGGEPKIDISKLFSEFRDRIIFDIKREAIIEEEKEKIKLEQRLYDSEISTDDIAGACEAYELPDTFKKFKARIGKYSPSRQRREYVRQLIGSGGTYAASLLLGESEESDKTDPNQRL